MFPEPQCQNSLPISLEIFVQSFKKTAAQNCSAFFLIFISSSFLKENVSSKTPRFDEKYIKTNCFKIKEA